MLRAAREYGLVAQGFRSGRTHLFDMPFPMIVFWEFNHFVVLEGIKGDKVYINDPSEGPRQISLQEPLSRAASSISTRSRSGTMPWSHR